MATHLNRDYLTQFVGSVNRTYVPPYILAVFLRRVLGFSHIGNTNFNINTVGSLLISTGDSTPGAASSTWALGSKAGINIGTGIYHVAIPSSIRTVISGDVGRLIVLRSTANPLFNSGIFLITGIDTSSGRNDYVIDWRSTDTPPIEDPDTLEWYLYEADSSCPVPGAGSGGGGYQGTGASTTPRVILQSPHSSAWQVRICVESTTDINSNFIPYWSVAPGLGGDASGDFPVGGSHLHGQLWYDQPPASSSYTGLTVGGGDSGSTAAQFRIHIIGDDTGQSVSMLVRRNGGGTGPSPFLVTFGVPDSEPAFLPDTINRLYVIGQGISDNSGDSVGLTWSTRYALGGSGPRLSGGCSYGVGSPVSCTPGTWTFLTGVSQDLGPFNDGSLNPGDSPFTSTTDLLDVQIISGALLSWNIGSTSTLFTAPRSMGTIPFLKHGRSNFGDWTASSDVHRSWLHTQNGVYMVYGGPLVLP